MGFVKGFPIRMRNPKQNIPGGCVQRPFKGGGLPHGLGRIWKMGWVPE